MVIVLNTWLPEGRAVRLLKLAEMKHLKNLLLQNYSPYFQIIYKCSSQTSIQAMVIGRKTWPPTGYGQFCLKWLSDLIIA